MKLKLNFAELARPFQRASASWRRAREAISERLDRVRRTTNAVSDRIVAMRQKIADRRRDCLRFARRRLTAVCLAGVSGIVAVVCFIGRFCLRRIVQPVWIVVPAPIQHWLAARVLLIRRSTRWVGRQSARTMMLSRAGLSRARRTGCCIWSWVRFLCSWTKKLIAWAVGGVLHLLWIWRRPLAATAVVALGVAGHYYGEIIKPWQSKQEYWYNFGMNEVRKDLVRGMPMGVSDSRFMNPEIPRFENSLNAYKAQAEAGIVDRILYGRPDVEIAFQTLIKEAVILAHNVGNDKDTPKRVEKVKQILEKAIAMNPGAPYSRDLGLSATDADRLGVEALAAIRNLEMFFEQNPQQRTKPKDSNKQGNSQGNKSDREGNQKGQADRPNTAQAQKPEKGKNDKDGQHSENQLLEQNLKDVQGAPSTDGI